MKKLTIIITFLTLSLNLNAQIAQQFTSNLYITPAITIGYTFRCGWNYGIEITIGMQQIENNLPETSWGFLVQHYIINYKSDHHAVTAINFVVDNSISQFGIGLGGVSKSWGYKKVNRDMAIGASIILNIGTGNYRLPWIGVKTFIPSDSWTWSSLPYYISYQFFWRQSPTYIRK